MRLVIRKRDGKDWFVFECTYGEKDVPKAARFWWNTQACPKSWATNRLEDALRLKEYASPEDRAYLEEKASSLQQAIESSRATENSEIQIPAPEGLQYLPFQRAGIAYALQRDRTLIADSMGLGKTIQAIGVLNATRPSSVLVICPATLRINWKRELERWLVHPYAIHVVQDNTPIPPESTCVIVNYERLDRPDLSSRQWDMVIADECHYLKNPKAIRTQRVLGEEGLIHRSKRALFLSGTPLLNRPVELWPIAHALAPSSFSNFFSFAKRYCAATKTRYGWDFSGASHLEELQRELRVTFMVRRTKEEVLKEIPPKRRQIVVLPPNGASSVVAEEVRVYREAKERQESIRQRILRAQEAGDRDTYKEEVAALTRARRESFAEISRVRHRVALAKVPSAASFIQDLLESEQKVVVWAHHLDVIQSLADALQAYNPVRVTGETPAEEKQRAVDRFQSDPSVRVFLGGITAAGVGITLTAASTEVFVELDWVPGRMAQAEDRCHRIGQPSAVLVLHLVLDGSLDQILAETLIAKQEISEQALDRTLFLEDVG